MLEGGPGGILSLALLLPVVDLGLLTGERTLVVLKVVGLGLVGFDAVEEQVAVLLHERVNAEKQVIEVRRENSRLGRSAGFQHSQGRRKIGGPGLLGSLELVDERIDQVRVVDRNRKLNENILVSQVGFSQSVFSQPLPLSADLGTYSSAVNLFSLNAAINLGERRKALRHKLP